MKFIGFQAAVHSMILTTWISFAASALAEPESDKPGWQADKDQVEAWKKKKRRPGINYDESLVPEYELPDPLKTVEGKPIRTAKEWQQHRPALLQTFREHVYGVRPNTKYEVRYKEVGKRENAFGIGATARQIRATISSGEKTHAFEFVIVAPKSDVPVPIIVQIEQAIQISRMNAAEIRAIEMRGLSHRDVLNLSSNQSLLTGRQATRQKLAFKRHRIPPCCSVYSSLILMLRQRTSNGPVPFLMPWTCKPMKPFCDDSSSVMSSSGSPLMNVWMRGPLAITR